MKKLGKGGGACREFKKSSVSDDKGHFEGHAVQNCDIRSKGAPFLTHLSRTS
jgi:hypothetical protein